MFYVALPAFEHGGTSLVVRASMAAQELDQELRGIYTLMGFTGLVILLLITSGTLLLERKMINPIAAIRRAAHAYASENLDYQLRIDGPEDLKAVADSMNRVAQSLKTRMAEVTAQRNELQAIFIG